MMDIGGLSKGVVFFMPLLRDAVEETASYFLRQEAATPTMVWDRFEFESSETAVPAAAVTDDGLDGTDSGLRGSTSVCRPGFDGVAVPDEPALNSGDGSNGQYPSASVPSSIQGGVWGGLWHRAPEIAAEAVKGLKLSGKVIPVAYTAGLTAVVALPESPVASNSGAFSPAVGMDPFVDAGARNWILNIYHEAADRAKSALNARAARNGVERRYTATSPLLDPFGRGEAVLGLKSSNEVLADFSLRVYLGDVCDPTGSMRRNDRTRPLTFASNLPLLGHDSVLSVPRVALRDAEFVADTSLESRVKGWVNRKASKQKVISTASPAVAADAVDATASTGMDVVVANVGADGSVKASGMRNTAAVASKAPVRRGPGNTCIDALFAARNISEWSFSVDGARHVSSPNVWDIMAQVSESMKKNMDRMDSASFRISYIEVMPLLQYASRLVTPTYEAGENDDPDTARTLREGQALLYSFTSLFRSSTNDRISLKRLLQASLGINDAGIGHADSIMRMRASCDGKPASLHAERCIRVVRGVDYLTPDLGSSEKPGNSLVMVRIEEGCLGFHA
jgi:hypothetical protein